MQGVRLSITALACGLAVAAAPAWGRGVQTNPSPLNSLLFGPNGQRDAAKVPLIGRYADDDGDAAFVLDRSAPLVLMRFDDSPEIWVLTPQPAARGDVVFRNDAGEIVLRMTRFGGMTLFTGAHPGGAAAALVGEAPALRPIAILTPNALLQRLAQASAHASRAAQRLVVFDAPDVTPQTASVVADAATVAAEAIETLVRDPGGRALVAKISRVALVPGRRAEAVLDQGVLKIVIVPQPGVGTPAELTCRPSSRRIAVALQH
jgi:hypothetical protein